MTKRLPRHDGFGAALAVQFAVGIPIVGFLFYRSISGVVRASMAGDGTALSRYISVSVGAIAFCLVVTAVGTLPAGLALRRVRATGRPAWIVQRTRQQVSSLEKAAASSLNLPWAFPVSFAEEGIVAWSLGQTPKPIVTLEWQSVTGVGVGSTTNFGVTTPALTISGNWGQLEMQPTDATVFVPLGRARLSQISEMCRQYVSSRSVP